MGKWRLFLLVAGSQIGRVVVVGFISSTPRAIGNIRHSSKINSNNVNVNVNVNVNNVNVNNVNAFIHSRRPTTKTTTQIGAHSSSSSSSDSDDSEEVDPFKYYTNATASNATNVNNGKTAAIAAGADGAKVKRKSKKKGGEYKVLDNRDDLPFVVKLQTPDPYTKVEFKKEKARKNTQEDRKKKKYKPPPKSGGIAASLFLEDEMTGDLSQILGEFRLDKSTTSGDLIEVGDLTYQVQKARCQYKYAGGQKFVMVRKILEVKELKRVVNEAIIERQMAITPADEEKPLNLE